MPNFARVFSLAALALTLPQLALAHAVLVASTPKLHGTVAGSQVHVRLQFNSRVDGPHCTLAIVGTSGPARTLKLDPQPAPDTIAADAADLKPGAYTVRWQALASDGHITRGEIPFRVESSGPPHDSNPK